MSRTARTATAGGRVRRFLTLACLLVVALIAAPSPASAVKPDYVRISGNQDSRDGVRPRLIVLHVTTDPNSHSGPVFRNLPGLKDLKRLGAWFDNPRSQVSSHVANDAEGNDARYVRDPRKAWTQVAFNSVGLSIEQIASTDYHRHKWLFKRMPQLENTARWIAHWHRRWHIPIRKAEVSGTAVVESGVATHKQLGSAGGGHDDPGKGYPFRQVLRMARTYASHAAHR